MSKSSKILAIQQKHYSGDSRAAKQPIKSIMVEQKNKPVEKQPFVPPKLFDFQYKDYRPDYDPDSRWYLNPSVDTKVPSIYFQRNCSKLSLSGKNVVDIASSIFFGMCSIRDGGNIKPEFSNIAFTHYVFYLLESIHVSHETKMATVAMLLDYLYVPDNTRGENNYNTVYETVQEGKTLWYVHDNGNIVGGPFKSFHEAVSSK